MKHPERFPSPGCKNPEICGSLSLGGKTRLDYTPPTDYTPPADYTPPEVMQSRVFQPRLKEPQISGFLRPGDGNRSRFLPPASRNHCSQWGGKGKEGLRHSYDASFRHAIAKRSKAKCKAKRSEVQTPLTRRTGRSGPRRGPTDPPPSIGEEKERRGYAIITTRVSDTRLQSEAKRSAKRSEANCKPLSHAEQVGGFDNR